MANPDSPQPQLIDERLGQRFKNLATALGASPVLAQTWTETFIERYTEPQRQYHTLSHIDAMLECLDCNRDLIRDVTAVTLAIFFHDWVYEPRGTCNEVDSVAAFHEFAEGVKMADWLRGRVERLIERTITHTLPEGMERGLDSDMELFLDFDLEVLSRSSEEYEAYARQIRTEYSFYGDEEYRRGRAKVLKGFLERDRLYFSETFYTQREEVMRKNIEGEIGVLESRAVSD